MKALVLSSGGLDSTTCLAMAVKEYGAKNVIALSLSYGQKHIKELEAAQNVARHYGVELQQVNVADIFKNSDCSLLAVNGDIPAESYEEQLKKTNGNPVSTYVPFRNGLFLSVATAIALSNKCDIIYYGIHKDDAAGNAYPDCSEQFNNAMKQAIYIGTNKAVKIYAPFVNKNKADIVKRGTSLNVPYELTWSCYNGTDKPCGVCGTCRDRQAAFEANNLVDPLLR